MVVGGGERLPAMSQPYSHRGLVYWGLTPQQQPGTTQRPTGTTIYRYVRSLVVVHGGGAWWWGSYLDQHAGDNLDPRT